MKRNLLILVASAAVVAALTMCAVSEPGSGDRDAASRPASFEGHVFDESGTLVGPRRVETVEKPDETWRGELTESQYRIIRKAGTERPFTGVLLGNKAEGVYTCAACGLPLFGSDSKFESGTGWPSFFRPIGPGNVAEHADVSLGMRRVEITCARCDGHLGHVFDDGPRPTGLRFCVNSESIEFTGSADVAALADPAATRSHDVKESDMTTAKAVVAGGCFWCVEAVFEELDGVIEAVSGYAGGTRETATYKAVCSGRTGHAEAVEIEYDPSRIAYEDLLRVHFATHDATQLNRQGNDVGPQYRSAIFYANDEERAIAQAFVDDLEAQKALSRPIVTTLEPLTGFYRAEPYHQNYVCQNPSQSYVRAIALPKVEKVRKEFADRLKEQSPLEAGKR